MARGKSRYYRRVTQSKGTSTMKRPALPKIGPNFYDPQLNQFFQYLKQREAKPLPLAGVKLPYWTEELFWPTPQPSAEDLASEEEESDDSWYGSAFNWTIDKLSRPMYASAEATKDLGRQIGEFVENPSLREAGETLGSPFQGAYQGLTGQEKTTFADVLRDEDVPGFIKLLTLPGGVTTMGAQLTADKLLGDKYSPTSGEWWQKHNKLTAAAGLYGDIALDPTTYIGLGAVGKTGTGARLFRDSGKVDQAVQNTEKVINDLLKTGRISKNKATDLTRFLTAEKFRMGFQKQAGAKASEGKAIKLIRDIVDDKAVFTKNRVYNDTLENLQKIGPVGLRDRSGKFMAPTVVATEAATKAADEVTELTTKSMLDNYRTVVNADYKSALGIGTRKYRVPILPARTTEELAKIAQLKPLKVTSNKIQQSLRNTHKIIEDVYRVKVEAMHLGRSATYMAGRYIDETFKTISKEDRKASWVLGLQKNTTNGEITVRAPTSQIEQDAAMLFDRHVAALSQRVSGEMGELPFTTAELGRMLPPGLPNFFKKETKKEIGLRLGLVNPRNGKTLKGKKDELQEAYETQDWFRNSLLRVATSTEIKGMKDGGHALWVATAALEHAAARRQMIDTLTESFGFSTKLAAHDEIASALVSDLKKRGWREVNGIPDLKGHLFNDEVATGIERLLKAMEDQREWGGFVKFINRITGPFKFLVTQPNLGYHIRNLMGDSYINWIDGAVNPADYRASARLLGWRFRGMKKFEEFSEDASPLLRIAGDPMENALHVKNIPLLKNTSQLRDAQGNIKPYILDTEVYAGINKHGIRQNYAVSEFGELEKELNSFGTFASDTFRKMGEPFRKISEWREDYMRIAHFLHLVRTNTSGAKTLDEAMEFAADRVRMTHFDYTDFTKFEQQIMSNVFPFYKWTRKAMPLMSRFMFEHPGKVIIPEKITTNLSGAFGYWPGEDDPLPGLENALVPFWLKEGGYKPSYDTPGTDNPMFMRMPSPFSDILGFQGNNIAGPSGFSPQGLVDTLLQQSNPLIRIPYELSADRQVLFAGEDVPVGDPGLYAANQVPLPYVRQILSAAGVGKEGEGNYGPLASSLTGFYSRELTERDQRNELLRQLFEGNLSEEEQEQVRAVLRSRFGVDL